jgi:1-deoxy-D-xylulose-5-phosphate synthase
MFLLNHFRPSQKNEKIIGITPAMPSGSSLKFMMGPSSASFDVGIAEQHAVTLRLEWQQGMIVFATFTDLYSALMTKSSMMSPYKNLPVFV